MTRTNAEMLIIYDELLDLAARASDAVTPGGGGDPTPGDPRCDLAFCLAALALAAESGRLFAAARALAVALGPPEDPGGAEEAVRKAAGLDTRHDVQEAATATPEPPDVSGDVPTSGTP